MIRYTVFKHYYEPDEEDGQQNYNFILCMLGDTCAKTGFFQIEKDDFGNYYIGNEYVKDYQVKSEVLQKWLLALLRTPNTYGYSGNKFRFYGEAESVSDIIDEFKKLPKFVDNLL